MKDIIQFWKKHNIDHINFDFDCGGDSMNDTSIHVFDINSNEIELDNITDSDVSINDIEDLVYKHVQFYEVSDGHYQGECGTVVITLEDDDLNFDKQSKAEFSESITNIIDLELPKEIQNLFNSSIENIVGTRDSFDINYKVDLILTDNILELLGKIEEQIVNVTSEYNPILSEDEDCSYDDDNWYQYTCIPMNDTLQITIQNTYTVYADSD